jgi:hypothetical protein
MENQLGFKDCDNGRMPNEVGIVPAFGNRTRRRQGTVDRWAAGYGNIDDARAVATKLTKIAQIPSLRRCTTNNHLRTVVALRL